MKNFTLKYLVVVAQLQLVNSEFNFAHAHNLRIIIDIIDYVVYNIYGIIYGVNFFITST